MPCCATEPSSHQPRRFKPRQEAASSSRKERRPREGADDGADCVAAANFADCAFNLAALHPAYPIKDRRPHPAPARSAPEGGSRRRRDLVLQRLTLPTALSTLPPCAQLTPSSASRARREHGHPKASTSGRGFRPRPIESRCRRSAWFDAVTRLRIRRERSEAESRAESDRYRPDHDSLLPARWFRNAHNSRGQVRELGHRRLSVDPRVVIERRCRRCEPRQPAVAAASRRGTPRDCRTSRNTASRGDPSPSRRPKCRPSRRPRWDAGPRR